MARSTLSVLTGTTKSRPNPARGPSGQDGRIKQRREQSCCCSLIYKLPIFRVLGAPARYSCFCTPVETGTPPSSSRSSSPTEFAGKSRWATASLHLGPSAAPRGGWPRNRPAGQVLSPQSPLRWDFAGAPFGGRSKLPRFREKRGQKRHQIRRGGFHIRPQIKFAKT